MGLVAVSPAWAQPASWNDKDARVVVLHGDKQIASYMGFTSGGTGANTSISVQLNSRDYGRFVRWCGATYKNVVINSGFGYGYAYCYGSSTWSIRILVSLQWWDGTIDQPWVNPGPDTIGITVDATK